MLLAGAVGMAGSVAPAFIPGSLPTLVVSRLLVGAGEGLMMSAAVLWLLRLAGPARRGRALGHIGLASYAGLARGPLLADAVGGGAPGSGVRRRHRATAGRCSARRHGPRPAPMPVREGEETGARQLVRLALRPGLGLMLVNVGYVPLLSFGAAVADDHWTGASGLVGPVFAGTVIAARTVGAGLPDRLGARRTVVGCVLFEAAGLALSATATATGAGLPLLGILALAAGQALAVPGLGRLALAGVPAARPGAAAGLFFCYFDLGVGLGGPAVGLTASAVGPAGALLASAVAVAAVAPLAGLTPLAGLARRRALG